MARSRAQILADQRQSALDGDAAPSLDPSDPRHRRSAAGGTSTDRRFDRDQFDVKGNEVRLRLRRKPRSATVHLDFVARHDTSLAEAPARRHESAAGGNADYASVTEVFQTSELSFLVWPLPDDIDRTRPVTIDMGCIERNGTASPLMSWDLEVWAWEKGQTLTRSSDHTVQVVDQSMNGQDVDTRAEFVIPPSVLTPDTVSLKMKLTRQSASSGNPNGVAVHEILLTYGTLHYHTHER